MVEFNNNDFHELSQPNKFQAGNLLANYNLYSTKVSFSLIML